MVTRQYIAHVSILIVGFLAIPFLDRSRERDPRRRKAWMAIAVVVLLVWGGLTIYGHVTEPATHTSMTEGK